VQHDIAATGTDHEGGKRVMVKREGGFRIKSHANK
jgi:hypothetical protein